MKENVYRLVVLGDGGVGKTALTIQLCLNHFVETYDPTIEDSYRKQVVIDNQSCMLEVLDTAGQEEYTSLRDQWIRDGEGFVLVYSITSEASFKEVERFYQLIQRVKESSNMGPSNYSGRSAETSYYGPVPVMLVGNKSDRVTEREISSQRGAELAKRLGCDFIEASAKKSVNVEKAFYDVVRQLRMQKSAAARPRTERRTTPSSSRPKAEKQSSGRSGGNRRRRAEGGSKCVIL